VNVGLSPGSAITGFPPGTISGTTDAADGDVTCGPECRDGGLPQRGGTDVHCDRGRGHPRHYVHPWVYTSGSSLALNGTVTLDAGGNSSAVFIFQAGSTLTTGVW